MTAFIPSGLQDSDIEKLQQMNERDEIIEVYQYLATHGDQYAKAALPVVEAALGGNEHWFYGSFLSGYRQDSLEQRDARCLRESLSSGCQNLPSQLSESALSQQQHQCLAHYRAD